MKSIWKYAGQISAKVLSQIRMFHHEVKSICPWAINVNTSGAKGSPEIIPTFTYGTKNKEDGSKVKEICK